MANDIWYTIKNNRLKQGYVEGFELSFWTKKLQIILLF